MFHWKIMENHDVSWENLENHHVSWENQWPSFVVTLVYQRVTEMALDPHRWEMVTQTAEETSHPPQPVSYRAKNRNVCSGPRFQE